MNILQVNTLYGRGGAAMVAANLHRGFLRLGHGSHIAVGHAPELADGILEIPTPRPSLNRRIIRRACSELARVSPKLAASLEALAAGRRDDPFHFPASARILGLPPVAPDVVHLHNLHGDYFDLRLLASWSARLPVFLTLHDCWMLTGHCAHPFACDKWKTGCGDCPDLSIPPALATDRTAELWQAKADIYKRSRLHLCTPSQWLMDKVQSSMLASASVEARVIPNGVDRTVFHPNDRAAARHNLGLPTDAHILLFAANGIRNSIWKDFDTLLGCLGRLTSPDGRPIVMLALGDSAPNEQVGEVKLTYIPHTSDLGKVVGHYQAADLYLHAARADTFPNVVIEALACGTPVVANAVGGIPEQIRSLDAPGSHPAYSRWGADQATGAVTLPGPEAMAAAVNHLLAHPETREKLAANAVMDCAQRFDLERQVRDTLAWYAEATARPRVASLDHR